MSTSVLENINENLEENIELIESLAEIDGKFASPINLNITHMNVIKLEYLQWIHIDVVPKKMKLTNTGFTGKKNIIQPVNSIAILSANWQKGRHHLVGGPFLRKYIFAQIHFHWGENAMNGSEHTIDGGSMPLELHAVYYKDKYETLESALRRDDGLTILVYFFKDETNKVIQEVLNHFPLIQTAHSSVRIDPFSLANIISPFRDDYFLYWGSMTTAHNINRVLWVINRVPIGISSEQDYKGMPILKNLRPLQERHDRTVFHVCPSGSMYASLLPIARNYRVEEEETVSVANKAPAEKQ